MFTCAWRATRRAMFTKSSVSVPNTELPVILAMTRTGRVSPYEIRPFVIGWRALRLRLRRETQSNGESMRPLWFFHLYILSSATTVLSSLCQGRLYPHIYIYIYICDRIGSLSLFFILYLSIRIFWFHKHFIRIHI